MYKNISYNKITPYISTPRLDTYINFFQEHSIEEVYGVYIWNKVLCSAIYPLLQAAEVALRNAINTAAVNAFGDYWYDQIGNHKFPPALIKENFNHTNLKQNFEKARTNVNTKINNQRKIQGKNKLPANHRPAFDVVVAATDFSTWEFILHPCHYQLNGPDFLWPKYTKKAFKNWPDQSSQVTHTVLYDIVSELRIFRNRLSHHEPLWKGISVTTEAEAIEYVNKKIAKIEQLIGIISKDKLSLLDSQKLIKKAKYIASKDMLDICRHRAKGKDISINRKNKLKRFLAEIRTHKKPELISISGCKYIIEAL
ncbi:Abi family protein [Aeromonas sp. 75A]|uniref:Abi family protein n=1 Tax=unclassified Aeromonas TaxID=257493 RepID=UPI002E7B6104|nr:Abi family protein [Aeromonas sp. 43P]MEE1955464.1 Abi family protein [Aeromonas sp. 43P]